MAKTAGMGLSRIAAACAIALTVVTGHITDATTGQPLTNVTISVGSHRTATDAHGNYRFSGVAPGRYTLSASSKDVPPQRRAIVVTSAAQTKIDLTLCSTTLDYNCNGAGPGAGPG
ncbi:MAG TPA: carboxypeptidase regulatory-like domain-containing protein [Candidatus Cybelea sp.]|jgi:protocatechuate 3,4-dioxygenase beta subunit|nr:carboxypeptidase regulatory-like domain-containing protein [Candidatus Cybelea sp.]